MDIIKFYSNFKQILLGLEKTLRFFKLYALLNTLHDISVINFQPVPLNGPICIDNLRITC